MRNSSSSPRVGDRCVRVRVCACLRGFVRISVGLGHRLLPQSSSITINDADAADYHRDWQESSFLCISTETCMGPPGIPGTTAPGGGPPGAPGGTPGTGPFVGGPRWDEGGFRLPGGGPEGPPGPGGPGPIRWCDGGGTGLGSLPR